MESRNGTAGNWPAFTDFRYELLHSLPVIEECVVGRQADAYKCP